jgi:hypothetical protein
MIESAQSKENGEGQDMAPDTKSFNIVLNALAQGKHKNSEVRAEALLERMESFVSSSSESGSSIAWNCPPDEISFNTVLNCWAVSRQKGAAERATTILDHMKKRHEAGVTKVSPDWSTYTTGKILWICLFVCLVSKIKIFLFIELLSLLTTTNQQQFSKPGPDPETPMHFIAPKPSSRNTRKPARMENRGSLTMPLRTTR